MNLPTFHQLRMNLKTSSQIIQAESKHRHEL